MAPVLKTGEVKASVGSNPTLSVSALNTAIPEFARVLALNPERHGVAVGYLLTGRSAQRLVLAQQASVRSPTRWPGA